MCLPFLHSRLDPLERVNFRQSNALDCSGSIVAGEYRYGDYAVASPFLHRNPVTKEINGLHKEVDTALLPPDQEHNR